MHLRFASIIFLLAICISKSFGTTYYVKAAGNDNLDGTSIANAWKSLDAVRKKNFGAGDIILLEGGTIFNGYLFFDKDDLGNPSNPITISSYGTGKATINSGDNYGIYLYNVASFKFLNIIIQGAGTATNFESGLKILCDKKNTKLEYLYVDNIEINGYGNTGLHIIGRNYNAGFKNITVINSKISNNGENGIKVLGDSLNFTTVYAHQNLYIANNKVFNNKGISNAYDVTGSGIELSSVNGAMTEYNEVYNNGELSNSPIGGPVGLWVFDANNVTIQYNESHHNRTGGTKDGGGFDLDGGTTNSIVQYNYSHDNDGTGYLLAIHKGKNPLKDNIMRYNISQNDGRKNGYPSVYLWASSASTGVQGLQFYNNTIYQTPTPTGYPSVMKIDGPVSNVFFRNNIFYSTDWIYQIVSLENTGITFQNNCYYSSGNFNIWWQGTVYSSLGSWRTATGQENLNSTPTGMQIDPQLNSPGTGGSISNPNSLTTLTQYQLKSTSPLLNAGLDLSQFGINSGTRDYFGFSLKQGSQFDIGAHESAVAGTNTNITINLSSPVPGSIFTSGASLELTAQAASGNASISKIEFYNGTTLIGTSNTWPYKITLSNLSAGSYSITAKAFNSVGASKSSMAISFTVSNPVLLNLRNPENPENTISGLDYSYYEGTWTALPNYNSLSPIKNGNTTNFSLSLRNRDDNFGFKFTGYIYVPVDGNYTFYTSSNDGSKLLIGNTEVVTNDGIHSAIEKSGTIGLKAGKHSITLNYFESTGTEALSVSYSSTDISKRTIPTTSLFRVSASPITCNATGKILREVWNNIPENTLANLRNNSNYPNNPSSSSLLTILEGPINAGDNYGARYRGYLCAPTSGNYTFWIASDNDSELWLSINEDPANTTKIAYSEGYTSSREWEKFPTQKSSSIFLNKGRYYIEVLHKEGVGEDNLAVGWQLPDGTMERPIPGIRLSAFGVSNNNPPTVSIISPTNNASFLAPANITINANASDTDGSISKVDFYQGQTLLGTDNTSPYSFSWTNITDGNYTLTAKAFDNGGSQTTSTPINVSVTSGNNCTSGGTILREYWSGVSGSSVSQIPINTIPISKSNLSIFEGPTNVADNYGARYSGYICAPLTGAYTFWIASNDNSELWLSTDDNPANKVKIAFISSYTDARQWDKLTSQKSTNINLLAGKKYYIEALHKEGLNSDHLAVGWQLPNGTQERPIPGNRLSPFGESNIPPSINILSPTSGNSFTAPASVTITTNPSDSDGTITKVEFYQNNNLIGTTNQSPFNFTWTNVAEGNYTLTAKAFDNGGLQTTSSPVNISVTANSNCSSSGTISREYWAGISGTAVSQIPVGVPPTSTSSLTIFEGPTNAADNYGARYSGYICAPITGTYIFWIACNDNGELWLSTDENPSNKVKIAFVSSYTGVREWDKIASQKSAGINLIAGKKYYIEALHKEGTNSDNLAVGWQLPNGVQERPIPGNRLSPITNLKISSNNAITLSASDEDNSPKEGSKVKVNVYPNPINKGELSITIEGYQDNKNKVLIDILSLQGKILYSDKVTCDITCPRTIIPIDHTFPKGIYIIKVRIDGQVYTEKLFID